VSGNALIRAEAVMGTLVTMHVVDGVNQAGAHAAMGRAFAWFHQIESCCTRFEEHSELMQVTARAGAPVEASAMLYEAVRFALMVAEESGGAFDPTVGHRMAARGFNREHRTGAEVQTMITTADDVSYRDVALDAERKTITLLRPLTLDLGAVAKGLAVDTAAHELKPFRDFAIDAGGDLYLGGTNARGAPWQVGIRHPRREGELMEVLSVSDLAVCTSGDYERRTAAGEAHILDPRTGESSRSVASATVVAKGAMLADALATAAFVLGPEDGMRLFERMGVDGLIVTPELQRYETRGLCRAA
jgi:thiamine biosynthesis lipoprotein